MSVYVDEARIKYGQMLMSHMVADSTEALLTMADRIGVARRWLQHPGTWREHFDICMSKRKRALSLGAVAINMVALGRILSQRRPRAVESPVV